MALACLASSIRRLLGVDLPYTIKSQGDKSFGCRTALHHINRVMGHSEVCVFGDILDVLPPTVKDWTQSIKIVLVTTTPDDIRLALGRSTSAEFEKAVANGEDVTGGRGNMPTSDSSTSSSSSSSSTTSSDAVEVNPRHRIITSSHVKGLFNKGLRLKKALGNAMPDWHLIGHVSAGPSDGGS